MSDFGTISYDFGAIADAGSGLKSEAMNIVSALEDMEKKFQTFISTHWTGGQGNEAFAQVQGNWRQQSDELMMTLAQLGTKTVSAGEGMQGADVLAAKMLMG
ncbi:WXG100 family type VII secretion target [Nocardia pseudobrasiliensis]|uniref:WXG100 family type VII secretion target n=1 Tax=Nocardia pseudobrasiliensis TaxID=45979 RepID=A0A370I2T4_9NOCA|nr:WXG100 family type VII secretion target [Nocardia pseudobrasiliensis]RDI64471.1 WXG100 family type VII secretion target [Nocardia pseudobrasiliensis]